MTITESLPSSENTYQWFSSVDSTDPDTGTWTVISGATQQTYDPGLVAATISFFRQVQKGNGCTANSNAVVITVLIVNVFNMLINTMKIVVENFKGVMCMKLVDLVLCAAPLLALENKHNYSASFN